MYDEIWFVFGALFPSANESSNGHLMVFSQERNHENDKKFLQKVFERIDEDGAALGAGRLEQEPKPLLLASSNGHFGSINQHRDLNILKMMAIVNFVVSNILLPRNMEYNDFLYAGFPK